MGIFEIRLHIDLEIVTAIERLWIAEWRMLPEEVKGGQAHAVFESIVFDGNQSVRSVDLLQSFEVCKSLAADGIVSDSHIFQRHSLWIQVHPASIITALIHLIVSKPTVKIYSKLSRDFVQKPLDVTASAVLISKRLLFHRLVGRERKQYFASFHGYTTVSPRRRAKHAGSDHSEQNQCKTSVEKKHSSVE